MMRNGKRLSLAVVVLLGLSGAAAAQDGEVDKLKAIQIRLDQMSKALEQDFKTVGEHIRGLKDELAAANKDTQLKLQDAQNRIAQLEKLVIQLRNDVDAAQKRIALYPPDDKARTSFYNPAALGTLLVENRYTEEILLTVNGSPFRVAPNSSRQIENIPVGAVTYEIISRWGVQRRTSTIVANAPLRVTVQ